jgi:hypothetical protein
MNDQCKDHPALLSVQQALSIARDTEEELDPQVSDLLEKTLSHLWACIQADPDACILTKDEFAVLNFFISRFTGSDMIEKAVDRFWKHYSVWESFLICDFTNSALLS